MHKPIFIGELEDGHNQLSDPESYGFDTNGQFGHFIFHPPNADGSLT